MPNIKDVLLDETGHLKFSPREGGNVPLKSNLQAVAETKLPARFAAAQGMNTIRNAGISKEEIEFSGIEQFLKDKPQATKEEVLDHLDKNKVQIETSVKGRELSPQEADVLV